MNLEEFCQHLVESLEHSSARSHCIRYGFTGDPEVTLDERLLSEVVGNLLSNALKYSAPGSQVDFDVDAGTLPDSFTGVVFSNEFFDALPVDVAVFTENQFRQELVASLNVGGCSQGACHGLPSGRGGFRLSLRGYDPAADYLELTRDVLGRRTDRLDPETSLIYLKALGRHIGVEISVNTSFNVAGPIAQTPQQAIETLGRSKGLDAVVMVASDGTVTAAWHGGERDSGRFRDWYVRWKATHTINVQA